RSACIEAVRREHVTVHRLDAAVRNAQPDLVVVPGRDLLVIHECSEAVAQFEQVSLEPVRVQDYGAVLIVVRHDRDLVDHDDRTYHVAGCIRQQDAYTRLSSIVERIVTTRSERGGESNQRGRAAHPVSLHSLLLLRGCSRLRPFVVAVLTNGTCTKSRHAMQHLRARACRGRIRDTTALARTSADRPPAVTMRGRNPSALQGGILMRPGQ